MSCTEFSFFRPHAPLSRGPSDRKATMTPSVEANNSDNEKKQHGAIEAIYRFLFESANKVKEREFKKKIVFYIRGEHGCEHV